MGTNAPMIPRCTECGKLFVSFKALFGHMRCHPERQRRGGIVKPPLNSPPRRRRRRPRPAISFTIEEHEVVSSLILLAKGSPKLEDGGSTSAHSDSFAAAADDGDSRDFVLLDLNSPSPFFNDDVDVELTLSI